MNGATAPLPVTRYPAPLPCPIADYWTSQPEGDEPVCPFGSVTDLWQGTGPAVGLNNSWSCSQAHQPAACVYEDELFKERMLLHIRAHNASSAPFFGYVAWCVLRAVGSAAQTVRMRDGRTRCRQRRTPPSQAQLPCPARGAERVCRKVRLYRQLAARPLCCQGERRHVGGGECWCARFDFVCRQRCLWCFGDGPCAKTCPPLRTQSLGGVQTHARYTLIPPPPL